MSVHTATGVDVVGEMRDGYDTVLTPAALDFIAGLQREFGPRRLDVLNQRGQRQRDIDLGAQPDFAESTRHIREGDWRIAALPADLHDRRVEITGPTERKMVINALNSGARAFMADFEDSNSPTWDNMVQGQINLRDAVRRTIDFTAPTGKHYVLSEQPATLMVRPRGWHLEERHIRVDGQPMSAGIFDFGLYLFHNVAVLQDRGTGPYFYLPKLQNHLEARLWNDIFNKAQDDLGCARGTIKATVLIEHLLATFEADEILYELREHSAGLNCGRWDYIFSFIKVFRGRPECVLPDRAEITMNTPFMRAYARHVIATCHRRGAPAIGGMAAHIPIKDDPVANEAAFAKVRADKEREVKDGHDGTWVAHPGLVALATEIFDAGMPQANNLNRPIDPARISREELVAVPTGHVTEAGLRTNIAVGVRYLESWLRGNGCVPLNHLMEDAATAEISRAQVWQWLRHPGGILEDGRRIDVELFRALLADELAHMMASAGPGARFEQAAQLFDSISTSEDLIEFLTLPAYELLG